ncbi:hypothetical protein PIB30_050616 [Stylosanthes scabra]|uniref:Uncharacterized protein n=1 Tax=Stylosanthes scabra TaxID=79078 RepID=A0ABU6ZGH2_9FABA|nr:hypothetical protein [Stylosanthes scabra]
MEEERLADIGGGGDNYDLHGRVELRVRHMVCSQEAMHMRVKNYSIRRQVGCKVQDLGIFNLGVYVYTDMRHYFRFWEVQKFIEPHTCLALGVFMVRIGPMTGLARRNLDHF